MKPKNNNKNKLIILKMNNKNEHVENNRFDMYK